MSPFGNLTDKQIRESDQIRTNLLRVLEEECEKLLKQRDALRHKGSFEYEKYNRLFLKADKQKIEVHYMTPLQIFRHRQRLYDIITKKTFKGDIIEKQNVPLFAGLVALTALVILLIFGEQALGTLVVLFVAAFIVRALFKKARPSIRKLEVVKA